MVVSDDIHKKYIILKSIYIARRLVKNLVFFYKNILAKEVMISTSYI